MRCTWGDEAGENTGVFNPVAWAGGAAMVIAAATTSVLNKTFIFLSSSAICPTFLEYSTKQVMIMASLNLYVHNRMEAT